LLFSFFLLVSIDFPAHIGIECFGDCVSFLGEVYGDVVFETHVADVLHKVLEVVYFEDAVSAEGIEFVVGEFALSNVAGYQPRRVVGGSSAEGRFCGFDSSGDSPEGVFFSDGAGDDFLVIHFFVSQERYRNVAAVKKDAFVGVVGIVVVPVEDSAWVSRGKLQNVHSEQAGDVHFAGAWQE